MTEKRLTFGILCALSLFWLCAIAPAEEDKKSLTNEDFQRIARKYLEAWGVEPGAPFIWVILAMPNASVPLNIPGITFGLEGMSVTSGSNSNTWCPLLTAAMILSGSAVHVNGLGSWFVSATKRLMVAWRSTTHRKTPRFSRRLASLAKNPSTALSHEHEVGVKWKVKRGCRSSH